MLLLQRLLLAALLVLHLHLAGTRALDPPARALPVVVNTWAFTNATATAYRALLRGRDGRPALSAVQAGCTACEELQCDGTVGFGGSPDENGETTLDAMLMDGTSMEAGAVSSLRFVKQAAAAARLVLEHSRHTVLAGLQATQFALDMGLESANLSTPRSAELHRQWRANRCQPNFRQNVVPDPTTSCGPYTPAGGDPGRPAAARQAFNACDAHAASFPGRRSHDTLALVAIDGAGNVAAGCTSNGAIHKVPGRVGDCSTPGAGAYADSEVGGCGSTGDGDVHLRFAPCFQTCVWLPFWSQQVVEHMRRGMPPQQAAEAAVRRIARRVRRYVGAVVAVNLRGEHGGACHGWEFSYAHASPLTGGAAAVVAVQPLDAWPEEERGAALAAS